MEFGLNCVFVTLLMDFSRNVCGGSLMGDLYIGMACDRMARRASVLNMHRCRVTYTVTFGACICRSSILRVVASNCCDEILPRGGRGHSACFFGQTCGCSHGDLCDEDGCC